MNGQWDALLWGRVFRLAPAPGRLSNTRSHVTARTTVGPGPQFSQRRFIFKSSFILAIQVDIAKQRSGCQKLTPKFWLAETLLSALNPGLAYGNARHKSSHLTTRALQHTCTWSTLRRSDPRFAKRMILFLTSKQLKKRSNVPNLRQICTH